jgi:tetratricopeptide (TPR) repeat protein
VRTALTAARIELAAGHPMVARDWLERITQPGLAGVDLVRLLASSYREAEQWRDGMAAMLRLQPQLEGLARAEAQAFEAEFRLRSGDQRGLVRLRPLLDSDERDRVLVGLQVLQVLERWDDVETEAERLLDTFVDDRAIQFSRAAALERLGRHADAEAVFADLVARDPDDASAANYLGYMWADRGERLDEALQLVSRAVELEPNNPAYLDSLGWVHFRKGNLQEAEQWLRRAVAAGRADGTILAHLGEVLLASGRPDEARRYLLRALELGCEQAQHVRALLDGLSE